MHLIKLTLLLPLCLCQSLLGQGNASTPKDLAQAPSTLHLFDINIDPRNTAPAEVDVPCRAQDLEEAFALMQDKHPDCSYFAIVKGRSIERIVDVEAMSNGTMLMFTMIHGLKEKTVLVKVEDVEEFGHRKGTRRHSPVQYPSGWNRGGWE